MISSYLHVLLARQRTDDLLRAAETHRLARQRQPVDAGRVRTPSVTLRFGFPDDQLSLARLAALDEEPVPAKPVLLAEVAGELRAALSLADGAVIADPFHPSTELVDLLRTRAHQLRGGRRRHLPRSAGFRPNRVSQLADALRLW